MARRDVDAATTCAPEALEGKKVAVVAGTAHEAYLKALFTEAELQPYPNAEAARDALRKGEVDLLFGDGISLAFWLNGTDFGELLRIPRRALSSRAAFSAKASASRSSRGNDTAAAGVQLGAVPAVGEGPLHRPVAALFPDQPVLTASSTAH